ncbi:MAG: transglycosylase SLT domain-containing protein [Luteimonas sp.]
MRFGHHVGARLLALAFACTAFVAWAQDSAPSAANASSTQAPAMRSGREVYARFREGLADPHCEAGASQRWQDHFANAPRQMAAKNDDVLPLFGYVVDTLREAHLPTEYALIPFVESGYKPGSRSASGPAGLWQMIAVTARDHGIAIGAGYDGRLSPVDSTQAAVRYLKTLHGMFAGDWRLAVMAYNAGEYRVFGALKRSGQRANAARPDELLGLSSITQAYVHKLHALSCLLDQADDHEEWMRSLDRPVPVLVVSTLPNDTMALDAWANRQGLDAAYVKRMNPAFANGRIARVGAGDRARRVLAPGAHGTSSPAMGSVVETSPSFDVSIKKPGAPDTLNDSADATKLVAIPRLHTVANGESAWTISRHYGITTAQLLQRNGLNAHSVLRPGMVLTLADTDPP